MKDSEFTSPKEFVGAVLSPVAWTSHTLLQKMGKQKREGSVYRAGLV